MENAGTITSKITLRSDRAVGASSREHGGNLDTLGFNIRFIAERRPQLAVEILRLWKEASHLRPDDPVAHEEDFTAALDDLP